MTNKEKFRDEIESAVFTGHSFSFINGEIHLCVDSNCDKCYFCKEHGRCSREKIEWLNTEYKEPGKTEPEGYEKYRDIVKRRLSTRDKLEGLAEESAELSKACLKLIRACKETFNGNWTPVTREEAYANILEEITDILCYFDVLNIPVKPASECKKWERWAFRVQNRKDKEVEE